MTGEVVDHGMVHIYDEDKRPFSQVDVSSGRFVANLPHGDYYWLVTGHGRDPFPASDERFTDFNKFSVVVETGADGKTTRKDAFKRIRVPSTGEYNVEVRATDEALCRRRSLLCPPTRFPSDAPIASGRA